jgi:hypothetical protein
VLDRNMTWVGTSAEGPVYGKHAACINGPSALTVRRKLSTAGGAGEALVGLRLSKESNMLPKSLPKSAVGRSIARSDF